MIDRILCVCQTKGESLKWVDHLRQQIKSSRQPSQGPNVSNTSLLGGHIGPTGGVGGLGNPPPPPHVSLNHQPFELLTVWIRNQLVEGKFTREELIKMTKREYFSKSFQESHDGVASPDIKCKMRKEKKQLVRPTNKVECQFFSAAPEVNATSTSSVHEKSKPASFSYNLTVEPLKEENDYEIINNSINEENERFETPTAENKNNDTNDKPEDGNECDTRIKLSPNELEEFENDEDTITILIPDRSFTEDDGGENVERTSQESLDQLSFRGQNPFENDSEDGTSTVIGSNYGDETSSLFHENNKLLGPWGKMFPKQEISNHLHSPTNSTNYCSCNLEDLYKVPVLDSSTRLNSLPLDLGFLNQNIQGSDGIENEYVELVKNTNTKAIMRADSEETNENIHDDNTSLIYVDNSTSETSSMCVPYLPPMQIRYSDFDKMAKYAKVRDQKYIPYGLQQQTSVSSSESHEYVPYRIREIRSITPDRELLLAEFRQTNPDYASIDRNSKAPTITNEDIDEEDDIYAKLEIVENLGEPNANQKGHKKVEPNKEIDCVLSVDGIYACQCQCFPLIRKYSNKKSNLANASNSQLNQPSQENIYDDGRQAENTPHFSINTQPNFRYNSLRSFSKNGESPQLPKRNEELVSITNNSPQLPELNEERLSQGDSIKSMLEDRNAMESIEEELNESVDDALYVPITPDILRHVPNHVSINLSESNLTLSSSPQEDFDLNQNNPTLQVAEDNYGDIPYQPNSTPPYYYDSLWERYQPMEVNNNVTEDITPYVAESDMSSCAPCSTNNLSEGPKYFNESSHRENQKKSKSCKPISTSNLSCVPRKRFTKKSKKYCVTKPDENVEDIYGFTPNWPHDWNNTRACQVPLSSLSQDIYEEQQTHQNDAFISDHYGNPPFETSPTSLPIYSINRVMRNMPPHHSVLVTPEATSELYLECTLSARWLLIEKYPQNGFQMSSGGSSLPDSGWTQPYPEQPQIEHQNFAMSEDGNKKEKRKILSTLV